MQMKITKTQTAMVLASSILLTTGCTSTSGMNNIAQSAMLGAATGAVTQVNGNSKDMREAATIGALLGVLGGVAR